MKKWKLLPKMALKGILTNGMVYFPYMIAAIFSVFVHFVFTSILHNDLISILPYHAYAWMMLELGKGLLQIILLAFLFYAGSFVVKRRKKEVGLYSLLGLEKKHIGMMLFLENLMLYIVSLFGGVLFGTMLSKLLFVLLLRLCGAPLNIDFTFTLSAFLETAKYFAGVFAIILVNQLWEVGKSRPTELLSGAKKGEKEPKFLALWSLVGVLVLGGGYFFAISAQADDMILISFFVAVFLVIIGTYFVFTSGSVWFLKNIRKNKKAYYKAENFITISGMYYRMKKNAAGLVNICIFSTMVLVTLICTVFVSLDLENAATCLHPYDVRMNFTVKDSVDDELIEKEVQELADKYALTVQRADLFDFISFSCAREGNRFVPAKEKRYDKRNCDVVMMTLSSYEKISGDKEALSGDEILIYADTAGFKEDTFSFMGIDGTVKKEVQELYPYPKADKKLNARYALIVPDEVALELYAGEWAKQNGVEEIDSFIENNRYKRVAISLDGEEASRTAFVEELAVWGQQQNGYLAHYNGMENREFVYAEYGSLIFIGIIFGIAFLLCLIIIMYYKQISEGYEDEGSFAIMQKVGMSEEEIKGTIRKQIFLVFGLPLFFALAHTFAGMFMVEKLMIIISFYHVTLLKKCAVGTSACFALVYAVSYWKTARTYYRIVRYR